MAAAIAALLACRIHVVDHPLPFSHGDGECALLLFLGVWLVGGIGLFTGFVAALFSRHRLIAVITFMLAIIVVIGGTIAVYMTEPVHHGPPGGL
jgi:hypothetical protein